MVLYYFAVFFSLIVWIPFIPVKHWIVRGWDYVRVQTSVLQLLNILLIFILSYPEANWQWVILLGLIATFIMQVVIILPYTPLYPSKDITQNDKKNPDTLSLIAANVFQDNREYEKFCALVKEHDPDLFLTMESDAGWETALDQFNKEYPYSVKVPLSNYYGMHLYSKLELSETQVKYQVEDDIPSIFTKVHFTDTASLNLICVHPAPPSPTENETSKERDAELLITGKKVRELQSPVIVCGDLNDVIWSRVSRLFSKMTGLIDPRVGRGLYPTFHAEYWYLRFPIDHMFHSKDIHLDTMKKLPYFGSDHFAMYFSFLIENEKQTINTPHLDSETEKEIEENIEEGITN